MNSAIDTLESRLGANWPAIRTARARTEDIVARLGAALADLHDANFSVVVTGSLGRGEAAEGSDADWVLLVDGPSDPEHAILARDIGTRVLGVVTKDVGPTGTSAEHNAAAIYRDNGRVEAVATLFRDDVSLAVEAAMERAENDDAIVSIVRRGF